MSLSEVPPTSSLVVSGPSGVRAEEGILYLPPLHAGQEVVLALRPDTRNWLDPHPSIQVGSRHGWLAFTALEDTQDLTLRAR